ncbi:MAG TPA: ABC transporter ATP-binding protein [Lachnospiraceae bacterium]|nr:ABC transporter ATP-binding protein [Lachnospiraceae bacterium]HPF30333.1 ABC transporter ATP-binding protein [Lachnospiraceae bacterium]
MSEIIQIEHLAKYYQDVKAVDDISFHVSKGEMFGFLGVNGAGKSTTINMLCTLLTPTRGTVSVDGLTLGKDNQKIKYKIGVVFQNNCLDKRLTVKENLLIKGSLYEAENRKLKAQLEKVTEILELSDVLNRRYGKLSGGQKRRCEIASALLHTPEILFLDEPTTGLDPAARQSVWKTIHQLQKEMGMTVFLTTHYMEEAAKANHIAIMDHGKLVEFGTPFSLKERFAKDKLNLLPKQDAREHLMKLLRQNQIPFKEKEEYLRIYQDRTIDAIALLQRYQEYLEGFEVIQGTMDDVFLNVTAQNWEEMEHA